MRQSCAAIVLMLTCATLARADLVFAEAALDLGTVRAGQVFEHRIPVVNNGTSAVEVCEVKAGCSCVQADVEPRGVPPGSKAHLVLRVNTLSAASGQHAWRVVVKYRTGADASEVAMIIRANVIQEIVVEPPTIIVYADNATQHELSITDFRAKPLRILKLETTSPNLKASITDETTNQQGHVVRKIGLQLGEGFTPGRHDETLTIHTDDPLYRQLQVQVSVVKRARQRWTALPAEVALIASASQPAPSRLVSIRDGQGQLVHIERVVADDPAVACQWSMGPTPAAAVKITVDKNKMLGDLLATKVHIHLAGGEKLTIPVRCDAR
jgi:hypothetical protein